MSQIDTGTDNLAEANRMLSLALEELHFIADGAGPKYTGNIPRTIQKTRRKMNNNASKEKANITNGGVQLLNWDSSVNNWMDYEDENNRDSGTSSSDGLPASDVPTSSTTSNNISVFEAFLQAIDRNEIPDRPDLKTRLKIMYWLCGTDGDNSSKMVSFNLEFCSWILFSAPEKS